MSALESVRGFPGAGRQRSTIMSDKLKRQAFAARGRVRSVRVCVGRASLDHLVGAGPPSTTNPSFGPRSTSHSDCRSRRFCRGLLSTSDKLRGRLPARVLRGSRASGQLHQLGRQIISGYGASTASLSRAGINSTARVFRRMPRADLSRTSALSRRSRGHRGALSRFQTTQ